jgi:hypothetical protein
MLKLKDDPQPLKTLKGIRISPVQTPAGKCAAICHGCGLTPGRRDVSMKSRGPQRFYQFPERRGFGLQGVKGRVVWHTTGSAAGPLFWRSRKTFPLYRELTGLS